MVSGVTEQWWARGRGNGGLPLALNRPGLRDIACKEIPIPPVYLLPDVIRHPSFFLEIAQ